MSANTSICITVVDDIYANRFLIKGELSDFRVITAASGDELRSSLTTTIPDVILLDIMLPGEDGYRIARELKSDPRYKDIPIIFISAKHTTEAVMEGKKAGGDDFMVKPIDADDLIRRIERLLPEHRRAVYEEYMEAKLQETMAREKEKRQKKS